MSRKVIYLHFNGDVLGTLDFRVLGVIESVGDFVDADNDSRCLFRLSLRFKFSISRYAGSFLRSVTYRRDRSLKRL